MSSGILCQACGAWNDEDQESCGRCQHRLLVISGASGAVSEAFEEASEEGFSFDEHLLERISLLEEAVKRASETARQLLDALAKQEQSLLVNQTGLASLVEVLEAHDGVPVAEFQDTWQRKLDQQLGALEKRHRFGAAKEGIVGLYRGERRQQFRQLLEDAEYAFYGFDVERALELLEEAFKLDPANHELAWFVGETLFNQGQSNRALRYFRHVLEIEPDHFESLVYAGVIHHERGEAQRAEAHLRRAVSLYPESFLPLFSLGAIHADQGQLNKAVAYLDRAVAADPVPHAQFLLGRCLYEMGRLGKAIGSLEAVIRADPAFDEAHHLLGLAYLDRGWNRKALAAFRQAQQLNPKRLQYHDLVRYLSGGSGLPLPPVEGKAAEWLRRAETSMEGEHPERALSFYHQALGIEPDNPTLLLSYAVACLELDLSRETETATRKVLAQEPAEMLQATASATLIEALRAQGRLREGNHLGQELLDRFSTDFAQTIAYYEMAYNLAEMEEDLDRALDYAQRAVELAPPELEPYPFAALGWVHYKRREFVEAVDYLTRSRDLGAPGDTQAHLGMALLAAGEEERARVVLSEARLTAGRSASLEQKMMECLRDSRRLLERVQEPRKK